MVEPCFVANPALVETAGGVPVMVPTSASNDFQVTAPDLEKQITPRTKAILLSYPQQPHRRGPLARAPASGCRNRRETRPRLSFPMRIYERLVYGIEHINFASLPNMRERSIVLSGMSKSYAMTGWRHRLRQRASSLHRSHVQDSPVPDHVGADHRAGGVAAGNPLWRGRCRIHATGLRPGAVG